jgi:hypothetical protein
MPYIHTVLQSSRTVLQLCGAVTYLYSHSLQFSSSTVMVFNPDTEYDDSFVQNVKLWEFSLFLF